MTEAKHDAYADVIGALLLLLDKHGIGPRGEESLLDTLGRHGIHAVEDMLLRDLLKLLGRHGIRPTGELLRLFERLLQDLEPNRYTICITQENKMTGITAGSTGTFTATLNDNGAPIALPSGSTFAWSADDASASLAPSADSTSVVVTIPGGDPATTVTVTASTTDPTGSPVSGSVTVPVTPEPQQFTVTVAQTA